MKLHIGGKEAHPDWKILDIENRPEVDYVGDAGDLSQFEDESIEAIYACHVLEHFYHSLHNEMIFTLAEWHRVLKKDGQLMISVPDLKILSLLYSHPHTDVKTRLELMHIIFGAQVNQYDVHKVGFDIDIMCLYLTEVGFRGCQRVTGFNLFNDCSNYRVLDVPISLNMIIDK
ncbi:MAG: methyltransferase type 11 [Pseudanabaena frigida]|uniref:Methyltransferase type 11 n=1 Tax=Pseudanabaena frigida TaxID=945775 RepID=A0A2W4WC62_9CYAN|nr:MAG: methyltransferase type 11 [Pseudanabaena frigida]